MDSFETILFVIVLIWILCVLLSGVGDLLGWLIIILLALWVLGVLAAFAGSIINIILVIAAVVMLLRLLRGKNILTNR